MVFRRLWSLGIAAAAMLVAACEDNAAITQTFFVRGGMVDNLLINATKDGPMLVKIHGNPFAIERPDMEASIIDRMNRAIQRRVTKFTTDPAAAPQPDYRVVLAFGLPKGYDGNALCGAAGSVPALESTPGKITLRAAFCHKDTLWTDVGGRMAVVEAPADEKFRKLIWQTTNDLFPEESR